MAIGAAIRIAILLSAAAMLPDAPSGGPAAAVDDRSPAAAAPSARARPVPWHWPIEPEPHVMNRFGVGPYRWSRGHRGVDLAAAGGTVVHAAGAGLVSYAGPLAGRGVVVVTHDGGLRTTYEPVRASVQRGQQVSAGQPLGIVEASGSHCPAPSCLHWGALRAGTYLDPLSLVTRRSPPVLLPLRQ
jgi:murein DD-endopeptidase MepM/ murein hydrolase activator NlpD